MTATKVIYFIAQLHQPISMLKSLSFEMLVDLMQMHCEFLAKMSSNNNSTSTRKATQADIDALMGE